LGFFLFLQDIRGVDALIDSRQAAYVVSLPHLIALYFVCEILQVLLLKLQRRNFELYIFVAFFFGY